MERNYLQVNLPNVVSITLMAAVGVSLIGLVSGAINKIRNGEVGNG